MTVKQVAHTTRNEKVVELPFKPSSPQQDQFIHCTDPKSAFVGSTASGKTTALCMRAWLLSYKYPGNKGMLLMYTYDQIKQALVPKWKECIPRELVINPEILDRQDIAAHSLLVHSQDPDTPSEILFRNLEDYHKFESVEIGWFGICQANDPKISRRTWDYLNERLRHDVPFHFAFLEANYGNNAAKGGWIWDEFINHKRGPIWEATTLDNWDSLPEDYKTRLSHLPRERQMHAVYGSWDPLIDVKGRPVYPEFRYGFHRLEDGESGDVRKLVTRERPVVRGIDIPGPGACVWVQMDERGRLLVAHELVMDEAVGTREFADLIQSESASFFPGCKFIDYVDPAAMRIEQTSGKSNAMVLFEQGLKPRHATAQIEKRLQPVKDWLNLAVRGEAGLIVDPGCHRLVGGFMGGYYLAQRGSDATSLAQIPLKNDYSHVHDALQYACTGVLRLQYAERHEDDDLPTPQHWLGGMRRR